MAAILSNLSNTIIAGFVLAIVLLLILVGWHGAGAAFDVAWWSFLFRWLHVLSGVMWIGILWYFNFVQIPNMPNIEADQRPAITKVIAPAALFWFRWGAMSTLITGLVEWLSGRRDRDWCSKRRCRSYGHRHRHVAGHYHVVQRLVHHLA